MHKMKVRDTWYVLCLWKNPCVQIEVMQIKMMPYWLYAIICIQSPDNGNSRLEAGKEAERETLGKKITYIPQALLEVLGHFLKPSGMSISTPRDSKEEIRQAMCETV